MTDQQTTVMVCANHPDRETLLRCNRCDKPICSECAILTPVGYRCKECIQGQQKIFDTARWFDPIISFFIAAILAYVGSRFVGYVGFLTIFIAPVIGIAIVEVIRFATGKRRSRLLFRLATAGALIGSLPLVALLLIYLLVTQTAGDSGATFNFYALLPLAWQVLYSALLTSTVAARLGGIRIK